MHFKDRIYDLASNHSKIDFRGYEQIKFSQPVLYRDKIQNQLYPT